jgi:hypothetical protein
MDWTRPVWLLLPLVLLVGACNDEQGPADDDDDADTHHCLDEGATSCMDGDFVLCVDGAWVVQEECDDYCDPELGCLVCAPGVSFCEGNSMMQCAEDGTHEWELMDCEEWDTICVDGECVFDDPCVEAAAWESNIGCEYWAVDLDNSENYIDDAAGAQFAVAVANIGGEVPASVVVEINNAPQGEPQELEVIEEKELNPGELYIFRLPRRDADGDNLTENVDDGAQSWHASRAFRIQSDQPIVAYQFNTLDQVFSNDASLLIPTPALGEDHLVVTYMPANPVDFVGSPMNRSYVTIVGVEEATSVWVTPSYDVQAGIVDCDDHDPSVRPNATEMCDGKDNDCDGELLADEVDADGDGWMQCVQDCDDADPTVYPFAPELCDGIDNDCNGSVGDHEDFDGDGVTPCDGDCNDRDPDIYPGAPEICDEEDNDCDGVLPDDEADADGDGWPECDGDCDDADAAVYPGSPEVVGGTDADCDGTTDDTEDDDGDGFTPMDGDCYDDDADVYPGAPEICDGMDNDCDGTVPTDELDVDMDGVSECDGDCDDMDATRYPGAVVSCGDSIDDDCDGVENDNVDQDMDTYVPCSGVEPIFGDIAIHANTTQGFQIEPFDTLTLQTTFMASLMAPPPDLTGTYITSDKPVSVFTGVDMTMVVVQSGDESCCAEHIEQQVMPSKSMDDTFVVSRSAQRNLENPEPDFYRIMAYADNTTVTTSLGGPDSSFTLMAGEYHELVATTGFIVESTGPLHVAQFLVVGSDVGYAYEGANGDSALLYVPALEQRRPLYLFTTGENFAVNWAVISAPAETPLMLDEQEVNNSRCRGPLVDGELDGVTYWSWFCEIEDGVHTVYSGDSPETADVDIAVYVYGYYSAGSYSYPAGSDLKVTNELSPT